MGQFVQSAERYTRRVLERRMWIDRKFKGCMSAVWFKAAMLCIKLGRGCMAGDRERHIQSITSFTGFLDLDLILVQGAHQREKSLKICFARP